jgi:hypothetical protein
MLARDYAQGRSCEVRHQSSEYKLAGMLTQVMEQVCASLEHPPSEIRARLNGSRTAIPIGISKVIHIDVLRSTFVVLDSPDLCPCLLVLTVLVQVSSL